MRVAFVFDDDFDVSADCSVSLLHDRVVFFVEALGSGQVSAGYSLWLGRGRLRLAVKRVLLRILVKHFPVKLEVVGCDVAPAGG